MPRKLSRFERRIKTLRKLKDIEIILENPCHVTWEEMKGDDRARECAHCQHKVYNFAGLPADEILDLINIHEGKLCGQVYVRLDGTVSLDSCSGREANLELFRGGLVVTNSDRVQR
ncbi:hypothetical protein TUMEXPCC7403_06050 [Tumidithrix helvetica PCC 7403]|uniref:hypothetical protein n=1 Tax=Tumidithrix helvetica TaxID=3457545 RepID=UPI003CB5EFA5